MKMKNKTTKILLCLAILVLLCGRKKRLYSGTVYDKAYSKAYTYTSMMLIPRSGGGFFYIPQIRTEPDRWFIYIEAEVDGERVTDRYAVSKELYDTIQIGDHFQTK